MASRSICSAPTRPRARPAFTPRYGAPEQFDRRFGATGPWTDVFALGLILVEMVLGRSAMSGDAAQLFVASSNVQHRPTLRAFGVDEGDDVERVLLRALAVDPKERYPSAGKLWDDLMRVTASATTVSHERAAATLPEAAFPTAPTPRRRPSRRGARSSRSATLAEPPPREEVGASFGRSSRWARSPRRVRSTRSCSPEAARRSAADPSASEAPSFPAATDPTANPSAVAEEPQPIPPVAAALCAQGLAPYVNAELGYSLCVPQELAEKEPQGGVLRAGELELTLEAGRLRPPDVTLDRLFARDNKSSLEDNERWILNSETKKTDSWYFLTGKRREKAFAKRLTITTDRYAGFEIVYPLAQKQAIESKLDHMVPTFAATTAP